MKALSAIKRVGIGLISLWLFACNPVQKVLNNVEKRQQVAEELMKDGLCKPDTFKIFKTDTLLRIDTLGLILLQTDTLITFDTVRITKTKLRDIVKTITIRDTLLHTVEDASRVQALKDENNRLKGRIDQRKEKEFDHMLWIALAGAIAGGAGMALIKR